MNAQTVSSSELKADETEQNSLNFLSQGSASLTPGSGQNNLLNLHSSAPINLKQMSQNKHQQASELTKNLAQQQMPYDCITCLNNNLKFCYNALTTYCCDTHDDQSQGCNERLDNTLTCSNLFQTSKSQKYQMCATNDQQCGWDQIVEDNAKNSSSNSTEMRNLSTQHSRQALDVVVSDDGVWRSVDINPDQGVVCSYTLRTDNASSNLFELKFNKLDNALAGLYYFSTFTNSIIDLGLVDPANCANIKHCVKSEQGYVLFVLDDTEYVSINLVPQESQKAVNFDMEYRLINQEEQKFMMETLALMGIGFLLILVLLIFLFKALNLSA
eukprot:403342799